MRCSAVLLLLLLLLLLLFVISRPRLAAATSAVAVAPATSAGAPARSIPAEPLLPCLEEVLPCTAYLNSASRPSQTCCTALNRAAATEMPCLCRLLADPSMLATFNVTKEQMFGLPTRCGLPVGCRATSAGGSEPVVEAPPPPAVSTPRRGGVPSSVDRCRSRVSPVIASVFLGGLVKIAAVF